MGADEALDLIATLPDGSRYVRATSPERAWSEDRQLVTDILDRLLVISWQLGHDESMTEAAHVPRPAEIIERVQAMAKAKSVRETLENSKWTEEV